MDKKSHRKDKKALVDLCKILSVLIFFSIVILILSEYVCTNQFF